MPAEDDETVAGREAAGCTPVEADGMAFGA